MSTFDTISEADNILLFLMGIIAFISISFMILIIFDLKVRYKFKTLSLDLEKKSKELFDIKANKYRIKNEFDQGLILSFDTNGTIIAVNNAVCEFFGFERLELIGKNIIGTLFPEVDMEGNLLSTMVEKYMDNPKFYIDTENEMTTKKGETVWVSFTNRAVYDNDEEIKEFTCVGFDITERKKLEIELRSMTVLDPITGILNRYSFIHTGNKELKRAIRYQRELSLVIITINRYYHGKDTREYNDMFIQSAVDICRSLIREYDYLGRIGDTEFAVLLPETSFANASLFVERIRVKVLAKSLEKDDVFVISSVGISYKNNSDDSIERMIIRAMNSVKSIKK